MLVRAGFPLSRFFVTAGLAVLLTAGFAALSLLWSFMLAWLRFFVARGGGFVGTKYDVPQAFD